MRHYGCGACGPRGFYGTTHLHLQCEDHLAQFCNTKSAILYSFGPATANSTIPAFCKRGDLVVVDEAVNFSIMSGVRLSRAQVITFRHNDISHLHEVLKQVVAEDVKHPNIANTQRRIIIVEGLYLTTGNIAPLPEIVALKDRYLFRLMLDDSLSLGVLGNSGRGALQHFNLPPSCVDIKTADLGNAIASVGGFCVGNEDVVDHQRLSGAGYCFSASQPPFLAAAVIAALHIIVEEGNSLVADLRRNVALFRTAMNLERIPWIMEGHALSPLIHIRCLRHDVAPHVFTDIQKLCLDAGVLVNRPVYAVSDTNAPKPSIRITISAAHTPEMIETAANVIREALVTASQP